MLRQLPVAKTVSSSQDWMRSDDELPGVAAGICRTEWSAEARNRAWVASALPHSVGIAYKPLCGEIAVCTRVGGGVGRFK